MRNIKKFIFSLLLVLSLSFAFEKSIPFTDNTVCIEAATKAKLNQKKATLIKGQTLTLKVSGTKSKVKWSSSNKSIATVSSKGKVTAKKKGIVTITAKVGKSTLKCKVTVETPKLNKSKINVYIGQSANLKILGTSQEIIWTSSNEKIVTVKNGKIIGKAKGTANVIAKIGSKKYTCKVNVKKIDSDDFSLKIGTLYVYEEEYASIGYFINPDLKNMKKIVWTVDNSSIATVDNTGKVYGIKRGSTIVTATLGGISKKCQVNVQTNFSQDQARKKLTKKEYIINTGYQSGVLIILKNNYKKSMYVSAKATFYNESGTPIKISGSNDYHGNVYYLESGQQFALFIDGPSNTSDISVDYNITASYGNSNIYGITTSATIDGLRRIKVTVNNENNLYADSTKIVAVFYDSGLPVCFACGYADVDYIGSSDDVYLTSKVDFDSYEIYYTSMSFY